MAERIIPMRGARRALPSRPDPAEMAGEGDGHDERA
jgi:hypothetical protein